MAGRSDRFGREKASQRRKKIRPDTEPVVPRIVLQSGDPVRWDGHEGTVVRVVGDLADIADSTVAGRVWRLSVATLSRR